MKTDNRSALRRLMRTLTDAELHDLLVTVQTELMNRPAQQDGLAVEVVSEEEAGLLGRYRRLPLTQRGDYRRSPPARTAAEGAGDGPRVDDGEL